MGNGIRFRDRSMKIKIESVVITLPEFVPEQCVVRSGTGLSCFRPYGSVGFADAVVGFLGCATVEIAQHFGKYFGMLITEAKYGDMVDFEIVENKYQ